MERKLYRSTANKVIAGVCGGLAEYFNVDPTIIRIAWILISLAFGTGVIVYIIASIIIPQKPADYFPDFSKTDDSFGKDEFGSTGKRENMKFDSERGKVIIGGVLILFGLMIFLKQFFHWFDMRFFGPLVIILIGAALIYKGRRV